MAVCPNAHEVPLYLKETRLNPSYQIQYDLIGVQTSDLVTDSKYNFFNNVFDEYNGSLIPFGHVGELKNNNMLPLSSARFPN